MAKTLTVEHRQHISDGIQRAKLEGRFSSPPIHYGINNYNWIGGKPKCLDCQKTIAYRSKRCKSCGQKNRDLKTQVHLRGINHPMFGKHHSKEAKLKISLGMKGKNKGEKQHLWKGGVTADNRNQRVTFRMTMQKLIFERDNYQCQLCDSKTDLQIDHIASWAEFKELRFDTNNCRTLCAKCHYKITFGREMPKTTKAWGHNLLRGGC